MPPECWREGPDAVRKADVDGLVVDQLDLAAGSIAESLRIPFVSLSCGPPIYLDSAVPAPQFGWSHDRGFIGTVRNAFGNAVVGYAVSPVLRLINRQRRKWGLTELRGLNDAFSKRAIVTQLPAMLDFERSVPVPHLFHTSPFG